MIHCIQAPGTGVSRVEMQFNELPQTNAWPQRTIITGDRCSVDLSDGVTLTGEVWAIEELAFDVTTIGNKPDSRRQHESWNVVFVLTTLRRTGE